jgi:hypothetical protein
MPGTVQYDRTPIPLARQQPQTAVFYFFPSAPAGSQLFSAPNLRWLEIVNQEGSHPARATFRYVFTDDAETDPDWPSRVEEVLPIDSLSIPAAQANFVVQQDDRLVVAMLRADGTYQFLFDGYAQLPEGNLSRDVETCTFQALGVAIRLNDTVIQGAFYRDATTPTNAAANVATDLSTRFNPDGHANASGPDETSDQVFMAPNSWDVTAPSCPVFIDDAVQFDPITYMVEPRRHWSLGMAVRYLLAQYNLDETYIRNPDFAAIDDFLTVKQPNNGQFFNPGDSTTFTAVGVYVRDIDVTGQTLLGALERILHPNGFTFALELSASDAGLPVTTLNLLRLIDDSKIGLKSLYLQAVGSTIDPGQSNLNQTRLARDGSGVINQPIAWPRTTQFEAGFVLAPGFKIAAGDASTLDKYKTSETTNFDADAYRLWVADEAGEGHWDNTSAAWLEGTPIDLSTLLNNPSTPGTQFVPRLRKPDGHIFSEDGQGLRRKTELSILIGYTNTKAPAIWDGTGTAYRINGGWELLRDRIGIRVTASDANGWNMGAQSGVTALNGGIIQAVDWLAPAGAQVFSLLLTTVVDADVRPKQTATKQLSTPIAFTIQRLIDGQDRYKLQYVHKSSPYYSGSSLPTDPNLKNVVVFRDDRPRALAEAEASRSATQNLAFSGPCVIPRLDTSYFVGDRIESIDGRGIDLGMSAASDTGQVVRYPRVASVTWQAHGGFHTVLQLADDGGGHYQA